MRKDLCTASALAVLALVLGAASRPPCEMKNVQKRPYCATCDKIVGKKDYKVEGKVSKCNADGGEVVMVDVCIRSFYQATCHPNKISDKPITCCNKTYTQKTASDSQVFFICETCQAKARAEKDLKHLGGCKVKKVICRCDHPAT